MIEQNRLLQSWTRLFPVTRKLSYEHFSQPEKILLSNEERSLDVKHEYAIFFKNGKVSPSLEFTNF